MSRPTAHADQRSPLRTQWPARPYVIDGWNPRAWDDPAFVGLGRRMFGSLRPVPGGEVCWYDPFEPGFYGASGRLPYRPLYAILCDIDCEDQSALIAFTARWGILGTFLHQLRHADYAEPLTSSGDRTYRVARAGELPARFRKTRWTSAGTNAGDWPASQIVATKMGYGCVESARPDLWEDLVKELDTQRLDDLSSLVPGRVTIELESDWEGLPLAASYGCGYFDADLPEYYANFFPDGDLPAPDSRVLWDTLNEPTLDFHFAVNRMRANYALCVRAQQAGPTGPLGAQLRKAFAYHLHGVTPVLVDDRDGDVKWRMSYRFPSLLSAIYMMLLRDFTNPRLSLRHCANDRCTSPVITNRTGVTTGKYCSDKCKNIKNSKNWRARQRKAAEAAKGETK